MIVPKAVKFLWWTFGVGQVFTQVDPASPIIFSFVVDMLVRAVLEEVCGPQEVHYGLCWVVGEMNMVFYADDGRIVGIDLDWDQVTLLVTIEIFCGVGLETNLEKKSCWFAHQASYGTRSERRRIRG